MGNDLSGRRALVTGAGHGIGAAIALALADAGADVVVGYGRSAVAAQEVVDLAAEHGVRTTAIGADVTVTEESTAW
jgi:3-oxoacyl-[acyl-carrier protein] reductase